MKKSNRLGEILKTNEVEKQAEIVRGLIEAASAPVIDLVIRHDTRTGQTFPVLIGGNIDYSSAYAILDQARAVLHEQELAEVRKSQAGEAISTEE
jgi:hypothetical protein